MSKIKILDTNKSLHDTAKAMFDTVLEMQTDADRQVKSMRDVEAKIVTIEKTRQEHEEQRKKQEQEQRLQEEQREREEASRKAEEAAAREAAQKLAASQKAEAEQTTAPAGEPAPKPADDATSAPAREPELASVEEPAPADQVPEAPSKAEEQPADKASVSGKASKGGEQAADGAKPQAEQPEEEIAQVSEESSEQPEEAAAKPMAPSEPHPKKQAAQPPKAAAKVENATRQKRQEKPQKAQDGKKDNSDTRQQGQTQRAQDQRGQRVQGGQDQRPQRSQNSARGANADQRGQRAQGGSRSQGADQRSDRSAGARSGQDQRAQRPAAGGRPGSQDQRKKRDDSVDRNKKKKPVIKERVFAVDYDENPRGSRKRTNKKAQKRAPIEPIRIDHAVITEETVSVKVLSEKIGKPVADILKKLLLLGLTSNINSQIDFDTAQLISSEFGVELEQKLEKTAEEILVAESAETDTDDKLVKRPPVVTIMGHVDHGKTSLLDRIRASHVTEDEAGGITQHIGAYQVELNGEKITFIDTPGHEAFTAMRARGAQVTDIAVIVVAADDGIMPQTVEAINHAKAADVPIIVAVNKIDRPNANVSKITQELTEYDLVPEEWGGDTIVVPVSAKTGEGIDKLLEMILLVADVEELRANPDRSAKGTIIEAQLDKGRGAVATVLVQNGTLKTGDTIIAGTAFGRVRAMVDDRGRTVKAALPSQPVEVIGFSEVPVAGDILHAAEGALSKKVAEERRAQQKAEQLQKRQRTSLEDLFSQIDEGQVKDLNIVLKADVQGSVEAVRESLEKLSNEEVRVHVIHAGVGAITETDVMLAAAAQSIIIGFNVRPDNMATAAAERENIDVRLYRVIYKAIEDVELAMNGLLEPEYEEAVMGHAEVRQLFKSSAVGTIGGGYVLDGTIRRNAQARLLRDSVEIYDGIVNSLKRFKEDVREVQTGFECGIGLLNFNDIKVGDIIECYEIRVKER